MKIRWTEKAAAGLESIGNYIAEDNPEAALMTVTEIFQRIESLVVFPDRGRTGIEEGTRELVLSPLPYFAAYRIQESIIEILYIRHGARKT